MWNKKTEIQKYKSKRHINLAEARRQYNFKIANSYAAKTKINVEKESEEGNYHKLAMLIEEMVNKIMDIVLYICEGMANSQQKSESAETNGLEEKAKETAGKNKLVKRDVMTQLYNHLRDKKLKTTNQTQQGEILQTYLSPESADRITDPGGG